MSSNQFTDAELEKLKALANDPELDRLLRARAYKAPASSTRPGYTTTGAQTLAGAKTFNGLVTCDSGVKFDSTEDTISNYVAPTSFSPVFKIGPDIAASAVHACYSRIGNTVFFYATFDNIARGVLNGNLTIELTGLPTSRSGSVYFPITIGYAQLFVIPAQNMLSGAVVAASTTVNLYVLRDSANIIWIDHTYISHATAADINISGVYLV